MSRKDVCALVADGKPPRQDDIDIHWVLVGDNIDTDIDIDDIDIQRLLLMILI